MLSVQYIIERQQVNVQSRQYAVLGPYDTKFANNDRTVGALLPVVVVLETCRPVLQYRLILRGVNYGERISGIQFVLP